MNSVWYAFLSTWRARAVNGGALAFVEHTHLQRAFVGNQRHLSAQRVDFLYYLSFGGAAYAGIARQKSHRVEICGKHERFAFEFCGGDCRFAACVSRAYYYYVEKSMRLLLPNIYYIMFLQPFKSFLVRRTGYI